MRLCQIYKKLKNIIEENKGYITRKDIDKNNIKSWFLTDYSRKNNLKKVDKGFYASPDWFEDTYFIFQYKYPGYIFSFQCALYLNELTDRVPYQIEVSCMKGYNPRSIKGSEIVHVMKPEYYELGIIEITTAFGNKVKVYDLEKTICEIIHYKSKIDSEIYVKAIRAYIQKKDKNVHKLMQYAQKLGIEKKVYNVIEVLLNVD